MRMFIIPTPSKTMNVILFFVNRRSIPFGKEESSHSMDPFLKYRCFLKRTHLCWMHISRLRIGPLVPGLTERKKVKSLSSVLLFATSWTVAYHAPPCVGFSRQGYWSGLPFSSPGDLPNPGIKPRSPALQAQTLLYNTLNANCLEIGRSPRGGHGNSLQYSCLYNPMDKRTWWATVHKVAKSQTRLK